MENKYQIKIKNPSNYLFLQNILGVQNWVKTESLKDLFTFSIF